MELDSSATTQPLRSPDACPGTQLRLQLGTKLSSPCSLSLSHGDDDDDDSATALEPFLYIIATTKTKVPKPIWAPYIIKATTHNSILNIHYYNHGYKKSPRPFASLSRASKPFKTMAFAAESPRAATEWQEWLHTALKISQYVAPYLVLVNPVSGSGKSKMMVNKYLIPVLDTLGVNYQIIETTHPKHAQEIAVGLVAQDYSGVLIVGGDGLVHEFWNGMMARPDGAKIAVAHVPAGSGNGLAASLNTADFQSAILAVVRGHTRKFDLFELRTYPRTTARDRSRTSTPSNSGDEQDTRSLVAHDVADDAQRRPAVEYGHLSMTMALVADIDLGSEHLRSLGELRFDIYAIIRSLRQRCYRFVVWYRPYKADTKESPLVRLPIDNFFILSVHNTAYISTTFNVAPLIRVGDGRLLVAYGGTNVRFCDMMAALVDGKLGEFGCVPGIGWVEATEIVIDVLDEPGTPAASPSRRCSCCGPLCACGSRTGQPNLLAGSRSLVSVDGEAIKGTKFVLRVVPHAATVFVPPDFDESRIPCPADFKAPK